MLFLNMLAGTREFLKALQMLLVVLTCALDECEPLLRWPVVPRLFS